MLGRLNELAADSAGAIATGPLAGMPHVFKATVTAGVKPGTPFFPGSFAPAVSEQAERLAPVGSTWTAPAFGFACENSWVCKQPNAITT